jgi:hypothetical protein
VRFHDNVSERFKIFNLMCSMANDPKRKDNLTLTGVRSQFSLLLDAYNEGGEDSAPRKNTSPLSVY